VILLGADALADAPRGEGFRSATLTTLSTVLLTVCSQTVRILLDVAAHVSGKHAGQAHSGGRSCTSWDRLVGFKSRHPDQTRAHLPAETPGANRGAAAFESGLQA
jgi:hypothetical protein